MLSSEAGCEPKSSQSAATARQTLDPATLAKLIEMMMAGMSTPVVDGESKSSKPAVTAR